MADPVWSAVSPDVLIQQVRERMEPGILVRAVYNGTDGYRYEPLCEGVPLHRRTVHVHRRGDDEICVCQDGTDNGVRFAGDIPPTMIAELVAWWLHPGENDDTPDPLTDTPHDPPQPTG